MAVKIYDYLDYRLFLSDIFSVYKDKYRYFTLSYASKKLGLNSPGYFNWIIKGKRNLSSKLVVNVCSLFELGKRESIYFELLVKYNQAKTHEEKKYFFDKIITQTTASGKVTDPGQYKFYEKWYYSAIREMVALKPFKDDYAWLAKSLNPAISTAEARKSIKLLLELGLIVRDKKGFYQRKEPTLTTGENWKSEAITEFQTVTMDLAKEALDRFPRQKRNISTLTLSCSEETFNDIIKKVKNLYTEIENTVRMDTNPQGVYQCNFQLFPLSKKIRSKKNA